MQPFVTSSTHSSQPTNSYRPKSTDFEWQHGYTSPCSNRVKGKSQMIRSLNEQTAKLKVTQAALKRCTIEVGESEVSSPLPVFPFRQTQQFVARRSVCSQQRFESGVDSSVSSLVSLLGRHIGPRGGGEGGRVLGLYSMTSSLL